jgi:hypothetical protein
MLLWSIGSSVYYAFAVSLPSKAQSSRTLPDFLCGLNCLWWLDFRRSPNYPLSLFNAVNWLHTMMALYLQNVDCLANAGVADVFRGPL